jgi:D-beta-D-heptose 7-phosphate kinase/D-beta-D-heptose 1-phosphate adenosyltransferase
MEKEEYKILVVGDFIIDRYWNCTPNGVSPEAPIIKWKVNSKQDKLGGAANVVNNLVRIRDFYKDLNISISFATVVNRHQITLSSIEDIPTDGMIVTSRQSTIKNRIISEEPYQQIARWDEDNNSSINKKEEKQLINFIKNNKFDIGIVSDYLHGSITSDILSTVRLSCNRVILDPKGNDIGRYYNVPDIIVPNLKEFNNLIRPVGENDSEENRIISMSRNLSSTNVNVILKKGKEGCILWSKETGFKTFKKYEMLFNDIIDPTGAGDTFIATLAYFLLEHDLSRSVKEANELAGISVTFPKCFVPYHSKK